MTLRDAAVLVVENWLHDVRAWWRGDTVSSRWLRQQDQQAERVEFHGVVWRWPANRQMEE